MSMHIRRLDTLGFDLGGTQTTGATYRLCMHTPSQAMSAGVPACYLNMSSAVCCLVGAEGVLSDRPQTRQGFTLYKFNTKIFTIEEMLIAFELSRCGKRSEGWAKAREAASGLQIAEWAAKKSSCPIMYPWWALHVLVLLSILNGVRPVPWRI